MPQGSGMQLDGPWKLQGDQACVRWLEPAGVEVERAQMVLEVNVHPFAAGPPGLLKGNLNHAFPDASAAGSSSHHRVLDPRVREAVPRNVHEREERVVYLVSRDDPTETVAMDLR